MKALTICQPYAHMILRGEKVIENRTWPTKHRGPMYLHAGKSREWWDDEVHGRMYRGATFGAVVGIVDVIDCVRVEDIRSGKLYSELADSCHTNGPWCWVLDKVTPIGPWPWRGAQGLFEIDCDELGRLANKLLGIKEDAHSA